MKALSSIALLLLFVTSADLVVAQDQVASDSTPASLGLRKLACPGYPLAARAAQIAGDVRILVTIMRDGSIKVHKASGPPILADYAQKNVEEWRFTQQPAPKEVEIVYSYRLKEPKIGGPVIPVILLETPSHIVITSNLPMQSD